MYLPVHSTDSCAGYYVSLCDKILEESFYLKEDGAIILYYRMPVGMYQWSRRFILASKESDVLVCKFEEQLSKRVFFV